MCKFYKFFKTIFKSIYLVIFFWMFTNLNRNPGYATGYLIQVWATRKWASSECVPMQLCVATAAAAAVLLAIPASVAMQVHVHVSRLKHSTRAVRNVQNAAKANKQSKTSIQMGEFVDISPLILLQISPNS